MRHNRFAAALLLTGLAAPAFAGDDRSDRNESVTYSGIGLTRVSTDFDNLKSAVNLTLDLGFRVPTFPIIGAEVEISTTIIPGENTGGGGAVGCGGPLQPPCPGGGNNTSDPDELQMNNIAVYGVFRSPGRFYGMGKIGYRYLNTSIDELSEENRSGAAYGGGAGYRWGESLSGVEIYYTRMSEDLDYLGFSLSYGFGGGGRERD
jgi:hypothetical protein